MDNAIQFGSGPLFRFCFALMLLGLARLVFLFLQARIAARRPGGRVLPPSSRPPEREDDGPAIVLLTFLWHLGLVLVPLFLIAHVWLWEKNLGFAWLMLPQTLSDALTLLTMLLGLTLFLWRVLPRRRPGSRRSEVLWPLLLTVPFLTGWLCTNAGLSSRAYEVSMLLHVYSADLILVLIPFTRIANCILRPFFREAAVSVPRPADGGAGGGAA